MEQQEIERNAQKVLDDWKNQQGLTVGELAMGSEYPWKYADALQVAKAAERLYWNDIANR